MSVDTARPIAATTSVRRRVLAPDLARGFMLLLIALAHAPTLLFGQPPGFKARPLGSTSSDHAVDFVMLVLVDNRAYPMFAALFGYGLAMIIARRREAGSSEHTARRLLRRRGWFLLLFGLLHASLLGGADVLGFYGLATLLVGWLLFRSVRALGRAVVVAGCVFAVLMPVVWIGATQLMGTGFPQVSPEQTYLGRMIENAIGYPAVPIVQLLAWPMLLGVLVGMWSARKRLLEEAGQHRKFLLRTMAIGLAVSVLGGVPGALIGIGAWQPTSTIGGLVVTVHVVTGLGGGFAYAAAFGLVGHAAQRRTNVLTWALAALGKRSLTFYVLHEALLFVVLAPAMFGWGGTLDSVGAAVVAVLVWVCGLLLACLLERAGRPGPADHLLRHLTYRPIR